MFRKRQQPNKPPNCQATSQHMLQMAFYSLSQVNYSDDLSIDYYFYLRFGGYFKSYYYAVEWFKKPLAQKKKRNNKNNVCPTAIIFNGDFHFKPLHFAQGIPIADCSRSTLVPIYYCCYLGCRCRLAFCVQPVKLNNAHYN